MSPQDLRVHLPVVSAVNRVLGTLAADLDLGQSFEQGLWLTNDAAKLSKLELR